MVPDFHDAQTDSLIQMPAKNLAERKNLVVLDAQLSLELDLMTTASVYLAQMLGRAGRGRWRRKQTG